MRVELITKTSDFYALGRDWNDLLLQSSQTNIFLTHEWLYTWWEVYGKKDELYILLIYESETNKLVGISPTFIRIVGKLLKTKTLKFLGSENVGSDFLDCIALRGKDPEVFKAIFDYLNKHNDAWHVIELTDMYEGSFFYGYMRDNSLFSHVEPGNNCQKCPYISLPDNWEAFMKGLSRKVRSKIGYYRRALERKGKVYVEAVQDMNSLEQALSDFFKLRYDRMVQKGYNYRIMSESYQKFQREICKKFILCDRLQLSFLTVDGQRVAFAYQFKFNDKVYFYQTAFDKAWSKYSVGFVLLGYEIQRAIDDGYVSFEFLRGDEKYKHEWGITRERKLYDTKIWGNSLISKLYYLKCVALNKLRNDIKKNSPQAVLSAINKIRKIFYYTT